MVFIFSDGNGFKTSTMRLGADAIVFTRCLRDRCLLYVLGNVLYFFLLDSGFLSTPYKLLSLHPCCMGDQFCAVEVEVDSPMAKLVELAE